MAACGVPAAVEQHTRLPEINADQRFCLHPPRPLRPDPGLFNHLMQLCISLADLLLQKNLFETSVGRLSLLNRSQLCGAKSNKIVKRGLKQDEGICSFLSYFTSLLHEKQKSGRCQMQTRRMVSFTQEEGSDVGCDIDQNAQAWITQTGEDYLVQLPVGNVSLQMMLLVKQVAFCVL